MGKKKHQNVSTFFTECELWLKKNQQDMESAIQKRLDDRIGPIGQPSNAPVYCSEISCSLSVYDIHNPQLEAHITYTLCDRKRCYVLRKIARAGLSSPLNTDSIKKRLCKNLSKHMRAAAAAVSAGKITEDFLSAEAENLISDNPAPEIQSTSVVPVEIQLRKCKPQPTIKDIQDTFSSIKTNTAFMREIEKYLLGTFSAYGMNDASLDIYVSADACKGGVRFMAAATIFFPSLKIPLPKIGKIINIETAYLSARTKEECLNLFYLSGWTSGSNRAGVREGM